MKTLTILTSMEAVAAGSTRNLASKDNPNTCTPPLSAIAGGVESILAKGLPTLESIRVLFAVGKLEQPAMGVVDSPLNDMLSGGIVALDEYHALGAMFEEGAVNVWQRDGGPGTIKDGVATPIPESFGGVKLAPYVFREEVPCYGGNTGEKPCLEWRFYYVDTLLKPLPEPFFTQPHDHGNLDWYEEAFGQPETGWSHVFINVVTKLPMMVVTEPLKDPEGKFIGTLHSGVNLHIVDEYLEEKVDKYAAPGMRVYIVESNENHPMIATSGGAKVSDKDGNQINAVEHPDRAIRESSQLLVKNAKNNGDLSKTVSGSGYIVHTEKMDSIGGAEFRRGKHWILVAVQKE